MNQAFGATGRKRKPSINITSLIDVMFLLLIFFMVSSTFKDDEAIEITLPRAGTGSAQSLDYTEIVVTQDGVYRMGEAVVEEDALRAHLTALIESDPDAKVVLSADADADWQPIVSAIDILRKAGVENLIIATDRLEAAPEGP
ncbi:MAG: biopolymer transporter ExbD [Candidatus Hydrogenedentota bacterium]